MARRHRMAVQADFAKAVCPQIITSVSSIPVFSAPLSGSAPSQQSPELPKMSCTAESILNG
ncbi:hypothetical protein ABVT39_010209 [Epinephelus coioides]